jgi:hypothetical protein
MHAIFALLGLVATGIVTSQVFGDLKSAQRNIFVDFLNTTFYAECEYKCKNGGLSSSIIVTIYNISVFKIQTVFKQALAKPDLTYKPHVDGCGSYSYNIDFKSYDMADLNDCCNVHDECYEFCNNRKSICDSDFGTCLQSKCDQFARERPDWGTIQAASEQYLFSTATIA